MGVFEHVNNVFFDEPICRMPNPLSLSVSTDRWRQHKVGRSQVGGGGLGGVFSIAAAVVCVPKGCGH